ncbi:SEC-C metal-binding domain-containing protein [Clostridium sp. Marseille-Q2269]|uniref:SEC-C metal-binding domain-containing protein n=1 Tax=Clostridium sp. Marseille-Q2269 TaxID=2942205 RepID=UPI00255CB218|nr:SEC-C metal-binding domain-containing protein [Clostridium sp. Marseille-Q2269]
MSLYKQWTDMVVDYVKTKGEAAFWKEYGSIEKHVYTQILGEHDDTITGIVKDLAEKFDTPVIFFMGFLDGINDSLTDALDLDKIEESSSISLKIDFEKLYFNMLEAKADYLYNLPQWEAILSKEKRKEIHKEWFSSKTIVKTNKVGRNESCPCGSGKKYKNCCGKNA